jgi:hypothetical protein
MFFIVKNHWEPYFTDILHIYLHPSVKEGHNQTDHIFEDRSVQEHLISDRSGQQTVILTTGGGGGGGGRS